MGRASRGRATGSGRSAWSGSSLDNPARVIAQDLGLKRITVTVTGPGPTVRLVALRSKYSAYEMRPRDDLRGGVGVEIKNGTDSRVYSGTNISNQVSVP